jgi:hypothetical protein
VGNDQSQIYLFSEEVVLTPLRILLGHESKF